MNTTEEIVFKFLLASMLEVLKITGFEREGNEIKFTLHTRGTEKIVKTFIQALNHDSTFSKVKY